MRVLVVLIVAALAAGSLVTPASALPRGGPLASSAGASAPAGDRPKPVKGIHRVADRSAVTSVGRMGRGAASPTTIKQKAIPPLLPLPDNLSLPPGAPEPGAARQAAELAPSGPQIASPPTLTSFQALNDADQVIPPDTMGAVGPNHIVTALNDRTRIHTRAGATISTFQSDAFWVTLGNHDTFHPRVLYDPFNNRWISMAVANAGLATSVLLLAVSQTADPTGAWHLHQFDADPANLAWADVPIIGFNKDWIVIQINMFTITANAFARPNIYIFDKAGLYSGGPGDHTLITGTNTSGSFAINGGSWAPAVTYDNSLDTLYLVQNHNSGSGTLRVSKITGPVGDEELTVGIFFPSAPDGWSFVQTLTNGGFAPQAGLTPATIHNRRISVNDSRMQNVVYRNGSIWAVHTILLPDTTANHSAVQWWELDPADEEDFFGDPLQLGRIEDPAATNCNGAAAGCIQSGSFFAFPSIAVNKSNDVLIGYTRFSPTTWATAAYSFRTATDPPGTMRDSALLKAGEGRYDKDFGTGNVRWGGYSAAVVDPLDDCDLWTIQEYADARASGDTISRWGTWWGQIRRDSCTTLASTPNPASLRETVTFTATVTGDGAVPTGTVTFKDGSTVLGTRNLNGSGQAVLTTAALAAGEHLIVAEYNGDAENESGTSPQIRQRVRDQNEYAISPSTGAAIVPGTTDIGNHCNDCTTEIRLPFPYTLYDGGFTTAHLSSNGNIQFGFDFGFGNDDPNICFPNDESFYAIGAQWGDLRTDGNSAVGANGIFTSLSGSAPNRIFNIEWRTRYADGGNGTANFEVRLYEGQRRFDIIYGTMTKNRVAGVGVQQFAGGDMTNHSCDATAESAGLRLTFQARGTPTSLVISPSPSLEGKPVKLTATVASGSGRPAFADIMSVPTGVVTFIANQTTILGTKTLNAAGKAALTTDDLPVDLHQISAEYSGNASFLPGSSSIGVVNVFHEDDYIVTESANGVIVPGTTDVGNHADDKTTLITLPFAYTLYDQTFNTVRASSNGNLQFASNDSEISSCVPDDFLDYAIAAKWGDLRTDGNSAVGANGIFTSLSGSAPNRIFNIEWRTRYADSGGGTANFEVRLYEGQRRFDIIYGTMTDEDFSGIGVQKDTGSRFTHYACDSVVETTGRQLTFKTRDTATALTTSSNPSIPDRQVTLTATVTGGIGTATGVVSFTDTTASTLLGTAMLNSSGKATLTRSLPAGEHAITAEYGGDRMHASSTSPVLNQVTALPAISINDITIAEGNAGTKQVTFTLSLSHRGKDTATVVFSTTNGSAIAPGDFVHRLSTISIPANTTSKQVGVLVRGDTIDESNELFQALLSSPTNATIADGTGTGTILDDDPLPAISINDVTVVEGSGGSTAKSFTISLSHASSQPVTVAFATADGTALSPGDYVANSLTLTFNPGITERRVGIKIRPDRIDEPDESFQALLSSPTNATIADGTGTGTILDDD